MTKKQTASLVMNFMIFALTVFSTISTIIGFKFMGELRVLHDRNFECFKYFTVDSNVFAAIISLIYAIFMLRPAYKKTGKLPKILTCLKLAATTGLTLTMMVTVFFLAPRSSISYFYHFMNANFFMHFFTPLLCIISFIFLEPNEIGFVESISGIITMSLYALVYTPNVLLHLENGKASPDYDWYGFLDWGVSTVWIVVPFLLLVSWIFTLGLWAANKKLTKK